MNDWPHVGGEAGEAVDLQKEGRTECSSDFGGLKRGYSWKKNSRGGSVGRRLDDDGRSVEVRRAHESIEERCLDRLCPDLDDDLPRAAGVDVGVVFPKIVCPEVARDPVDVLCAHGFVRELRTLAPRVLLTRNL